MNNEKFKQLKLNFLPRFWDKEREIMIQPELKYIHEQIYINEEYLNGFYDEYIINYNDIQLSDILFNDNFIMMKPTGLKDKNGNLIYEGDIIISNLKYNQEGDKFVIVGGVRGYCYDAILLSDYNNGIRESKVGYKSSSAYHIITEHGVCEIIGNIYENKE